MYLTSCQRARDRQRTTRKRNSKMYTEKDNKTVNILGTDWQIIFAPADEGRLKTSDGICDNSVKKFV